jgi:Fe-S-cluster containining protein
MPMECDSCGACCRTYPIFVSHEDAAREPRIAAEGSRLPESLARDDYIYRLYPLPFLDACCFLDGDNRCTIYASRPDVCGRFAAGSEQCQTSRQRQGLPPLA